MDHQIGSVPMFSKIGRYISNKLLKYGKDKSAHKSMTQRSSTSIPMKTRLQKKILANKDKENTPNSSALINRKRLKKIATMITCKQDMKENFRENRIRNSKEKELSPSVGHYKINYDQNQKNVHVYNFDRSVPHFHRDKHKVQQVTPFLKEYPDGFAMNSKGFKELKRMAGRSQIKGSVRKNFQNPHENRYVLHDDMNSIEKGRCPINLSKAKSRDNKMFKSMENSPQYDYDFQINKKKLNSHMIPFKRQTERSHQAFYCKTGISSFYGNEASPSPSSKTDRSVLWSKALNREKTGCVPSHMDKNINSRLAISMGNLKTLEMNCSDIVITERAASMNTTKSRFGVACDSKSVNMQKTWCPS